MSVTTASEVTTSLADPHHDGSDACVLERPDELGGEAVVRLRIPRGTTADLVLLRYVRDGEARTVPAVIDSETETETWWRASFPVANPATPYRWLLSGGTAGYAWLNGAGLAANDVPDADDFVLGVDPGGPEWHLSSVVYEVFADRFATSNLDVEPPEWAIARGWDELPTGRGPETPFEWFGGDLGGVERRLDHVEGLGASVIYLTPIFPASSTHRYDATSFDRIDPLLGGDAALAALAAAAHTRGIRVVGDLTPNHCGAAHDWFVRARDDPEAPEREFFWFDEALPNGYESWWGFPQLPKLDWRSPELERRLLAVARRWLDLGLDGWRIDVANMTGRYRDIDVNHDVARAMRGVLGPDELLVAELFHDARSDLRGGGWHGGMNYSGFLKPAWTWLGVAEDELAGRYLDLPIALPALGGRQAVAAMRAFRAGVPWQSVLHSWALLDSHDVARFRTVVGRSRERQLVGIGLQMTTPGVPMVFAGDEIGLEGAWGEDARRTMPWDRPETWDYALLEEYRRLIALRRASPALARGGIRYAFVDADVIAYLRESRDERLVCLASRDQHEPVRLSLAALGCAGLESLYGDEPELVNGSVLLPADGPSFHVWRLTDG